MVASHHVVGSVCLFMICKIRYLNLIDIFFSASKFMIDTGAGVIDSDYRGTVFVLLFNFSDEDFESMFHC